MKRMIQNVLCNTETAAKLARMTWLEPDDPARRVEELYRTKSGRYFLYVEGGPASCYARRGEDGVLAAGADLQLITRDAARGWTEDNLGHDRCVALFDHPEGGLSKITFVPTPEARARLEEVRDQTGMTFADIISAAVVEYRVRKKKTAR